MYVSNILRPTRCGISLPWPDWQQHGMIIREGEAFYTVSGAPHDNNIPKT